MMRTVQYVSENHENSKLWKVEELIYNSCFIIITIYFNINKCMCIMHKCIYIYVIA